MVFLVKLICTSQWGGEGEEVQMEKCQVGDTGVEVMVGGISGVGLADVDSHVFTEEACVCVEVAEMLCSC